MYLKHFAITRFPFDATLAASELFDAGAQGEAEIRLKHLLELRGIGLLTDEPGSGKTTLCRRVVDGLHPGLFRTVYITLSTGNVMDMYKSIAWGFELPTERNRVAAFRQLSNEVTRQLHESKQRPLVILDEAHHLRTEVLEDLRLLTNYEMDSENRLCLLFVGLSDLRRRIGMAAHESLDQRIVMRFHLEGLSEPELADYLTHRLRGAGCELPLFEPAAIKAIYQAARALPRKINRLAHYALTAAAISESRSVTIEHVAAAMQEIGA